MYKHAYGINNQGGSLTCLIQRFNTGYGPHISLKIMIVTSYAIYAVVAILKLLLLKEA